MELWSSKLEKWLQQILDSIQEERTNKNHQDNAHDPQASRSLTEDSKLRMIMTTNSYEIIVEEYY